MKKRLTWCFLALFLLVAPGCALGQAAADPPADAARVMPADISGHWAEEDIKTAIHQNLMVGTGQDSGGRTIFSPEASVSRAQLAAVLVRTFDLDYGDKRFIRQPLASDYYRDVDDKAWYAEAVVMCAINGIFPADGEKFQPNRSVSRIEIAQGVKNSFEAKGIDVVMIMVMPEYKDMGGLSQDETNALVFVSNTGIMKGDGDNKFRPRQAVKRAELARILSRCSSMMSIDQSYNHQEYELRAGQSFTLSLPSNPTAGYNWAMEIEDESLLKVESQGFQTGSDTRLIGQGGSAWWKLTALKSGTTKVKLVYARPWESVPPAQTFELTVIIK